MTTKEAELILDDINSMRQEPTCKIKMLNTIKRALERAKRRTQAKDLENFIAKLYNIPQVSPLKVSEGLCQAAEKRANEIIKARDVHHKLPQSELESLIGEFVYKYHNIFIIVDHGDTEHFISRAMISDHDPDRSYQKAIFSSEYNYMGAASLPYKDEELSVVFFATEIKEKSEEIPPVNFQEMKNDFITELTNLRENPKSYIPILEEFSTYLDNDILKRPGDDPLQTTEGKAAFKEAIKFLRSQKPVGPLQEDSRLSKAAQLHAEDLGKKGGLSHISSDGKNLSERLDEQCEWEEACSESIDLGSKNALHVIVSLLVDDGISERTNRLNLFREDFSYLGIGACEHSKHDTVFVVNFAGNLRDKGKPFYNKNDYKYEYPKDLNSKKENERSKVKTSFQLEDEDAPDDTESVKTSKKTVLWDGKAHRITKKYYHLKNGDNHIVEVEHM